MCMKVFGLCVFFSVLDAGNPPATTSPAASPPPKTTTVPIDAKVVEELRKKVDQTFKNRTEAELQEMITRTIREVRVMQFDRDLAERELYKSLLAQALKESTDQLEETHKQQTELSKQYQAAIAEVRDRFKGNMNDIEEQTLALARAFLPDLEELASAEEKHAAIKKKTSLQLTRLDLQLDRLRRDRELSLKGRRFDRASAGTVGIDDDELPPTPGGSTATKPSKVEGTNKEVLDRLSKLLRK